MTSFTFLLGSVIFSAARCFTNDPRLENELALATIVSLLYAIYWKDDK